MAAMFVISIGGIQRISYGYSGGAITQMQRGQTWAGQSGTIMIVLDGVMWMAAIGCFAWFITAWSTVGQKQTQSKQMREELQALVDEKREMLSVEKNLPEV